MPAHPGSSHAKTAAKRKKAKALVLANARRQSKEGKFVAAKARAIVKAKEDKRKAGAPTRAAARAAAKIKAKKDNRAEILADKKNQKKRLKKDTGQ